MWRPEIGANISAWCVYCFHQNNIITFCTLVSVYENVSGHHMLEHKLQSYARWLHRSPTKNVSHRQQTYAKEGESKEKKEEKNRSQPMWLRQRRRQWRWRRQRIWKFYSEKSFGVCERASTISWQVIRTWRDWIQLIWEIRCTLWINIRWKTLFSDTQHTLDARASERTNVCEVVKVIVSFGAKAPHTTNTTNTLTECDADARASEKRVAGERDSARRWEKYLYRRIIWKIVSITFNNIIKYDFASNASSSSDVCTSLTHNCNAWRLSSYENNNVFVVLSFHGRWNRCSASIEAVVCRSPLVVNILRYPLTSTSSPLSSLILNVITISMHGLAWERETERNERQKKHTRGNWKNVHATFDFDFYFYFLPHTIDIAFHFCRVFVCNFCDIRYVLCAREQASHTYKHKRMRYSHTCLDEFVHFIFMHV